MDENQPIFGAFNQGARPTIACFSKATVPLGVNFDALIAALQVYINVYLAPVWNFGATLVKSVDLMPGAWALVFIDDADVAGALAYHDLTPDGLPISKVFVKTTLRNGDLVSVSASHEIAEMAADPAINLMCVGPDGRTMIALENADAVEALSFPVNGIQMSDFVYPSYFEGFRKPRSVKFDHMGAIDHPFQILKDGYQIVFKNGRWSQIFGSEEKQRAFAKEDRRGHRSEVRKVKSKGIIMDDTLSVESFIKLMNYAKSIFCSPDIIITPEQEAKLKAMTEQLKVANASIAAEQKP